MRRVLLVVALTAACAADPEGREQIGHPSLVPGIETEVVATEAVRDTVQGFGVVAAERDPPELRDARTQLTEAQARRRLAAQQVHRLEALGGLAPRKEIEAARAEEASASAAADRARQVLAAFGRDAERVSLGADEIWVIAHVLQPDVPRIEADAAARFSADAMAGSTFEARVDAAPAYLDPVAQAAPVRVRVRDANHVLRPGFTGAVMIEVGPPHPAVVVPAGAIVHDAAQPVVFVQDHAGTYVARPIRLGAARDDRVEVTGGLEPGERVATTGAASLLSAARLPARVEGE